MNNVFDFKRFGNYFAYDLRRAINNYGISLLLLGLAPVILYTLHVLTSLLRGGGIAPIDGSLKIVISGIVILATAVSAGVKIYGMVTDKRSGSDFLMLPASTLEKWLSMVRMVCVAVPAVLLVLSLASDSLLSWIVPASYGEGIITSASSEDFSMLMGTNEDFSVNLPALFFLGWCGSALTFTLGGIFFKKAKIAKTILCLFALGTVLSILTAVLIGNFNVDMEQFSQSLEEVDNPASVINSFNWLLNIYMLITRGGLLLLTWLRLRTLKH